LYFTAPGYRLFNYPLILIILISLFPAITIKKLNQHKL